ncbi:MAG: hypothetical protein IPN86_19900 [Saprospiraceae bacterium]|nr:hypothetical protein [Saprospiraceae bacterium]
MRSLRPVGWVDSTNIIHAYALHHHQYQLRSSNMLGDTLQAIAGEKAGIIKGCVPAIGERQYGVESVFGIKLNL